MSAELIGWLVEATLLGSAAIVIVLILRPFLNRVFGVRAAIVVWAIVPLAVIVPVMPDRVVEAPETGERMTFSVALDGLLDSAGPEARDSSRIKDTRPGAAELAMILWAVGGLSLLSLMVWRQRRFRRGLGEIRRIRGRVAVIDRAGFGPLVLGVVNPRILVPCDFGHRFTARQRRLMLAHEYTHLKRGDPMWNLLAAGLRCLFWFNPLVHQAAAVFRRDQELACDARVLADRRRSHRSYAEALLALQHHRSSFPTLAFGPHPLKERIMQLTRLKTQSPSRRRIGTALSICVAAGLAFAAWAATPEVHGGVDEARAGELQKPFAFDVEVTVEGRVQKGNLTVYSDEVLVSPDGTEIRMLARDTLVLEHHDPESGWAAEVSIERMGDEQFLVNAVIEQHGETVATPRMIIGAQSPAWIQQADAETGEPVYRLKLTPIATDLPPRSTTAPAGIGSARLFVTVDGKAAVRDVQWPTGTGESLLLDFASDAPEPWKARLRVLRRTEQQIEICFENIEYMQVSRSGSCMRFPADKGDNAYMTSLLPSIGVEYRLDMIPDLHGR